MRAEGTGDVSLEALRLIAPALRPEQRSGSCVSEPRRAVALPSRPDGGSAEACPPQAAMQAAHLRRPAHAAGDKAPNFPLDFVLPVGNINSDR